MWGRIIVAAGTFIGAAGAFIGTIEKAICQKKRLMLCASDRGR